MTTDAGVFEAKIIVTCMGGATSEAEFQEWLTAVSLERLAIEMDEGSLLGQHRLVSTEKAPPEELVSRQVALANNGSFFEPPEVDEDGEEIEIPQVEQVKSDPAGRILRAQLEQGWTSETLEMLGRRFIEGIGMSNAFAAFLEAQAQAENESSLDGQDPEP
jgi:hypothetical protein